MKKFKKKTLLVGEGTHQHTLYGNFAVETDAKTDYVRVSVDKDSLLKHEKPNGDWSNEHKTLKVEGGEWRMGKQVEYNPFSEEISRVWD